MPIVRIRPEFLVNTTTVNGQIDPSIAALSDNRIVVTWSSGDTGDGSMSCIRGRLYDANGRGHISDFIINTTTADRQTVPSVTALADGRFVVTWQSGDTGDGAETCIRGRIYKADGAPLGDD